jgi:hypothetical protein
MNLKDLRVQSALATLEHNREIIRARFMPHQDARDDDRGSGFPRSATFRWLRAAVTNRQLVAAALQALLGKHPLGRMLAAWVMSSSAH